MSLHGLFGSCLNVQWLLPREHSYFFFSPGRSGTPGSRVTEPPCVLLWGLQLPPTPTSKDLGDPIFLCHHHSCILIQKRLFLFFFIFLVTLSEQALPMVDRQAAVLDLIYLMWMTWKYLKQLIVTNINSTRNSRLYPSQAPTMVLQGKGVDMDQRQNWIFKDTKCCSQNRGWNFKQEM